MKKDLALIGGLFLVIIVLLIFGNGFTSSSFVKSKARGSSTSSASLASTVKIRSAVFNVEVADTQDERKKGLADRESLPLDGGMLFVFEKSGMYPIWMKDMKFAIDIIWLDKNKQIVDIAQRVAPEVGKKNKELTIYNPRAESKYILELNAGLVSLNNIQVGDLAEF